MRQKLLIKFCIWHWLLIKSTCLTSSHKNKCIFAQKSINVECFFYWIAKNGIIGCKIFNQLKQNQPVAFCTFFLQKAAENVGNPLISSDLPKALKKFNDDFFLITSKFIIHRLSTSCKYWLFKEAIIESSARHEKRKIRAKFFQLKRFWESYIIK